MANTDPLPIARSIRLYRVLLLFYPTSFRREYGPLMSQLFGDCCRRTYPQHGLSGLTSLWLLTVLDTLRTALDEHLQGVTDMSRAKFIQLAAWALPISGISLLAGFLANNRPTYDPYNFASLSVDRYLNLLADPLIVFGLLLLSFGMLGLQVRLGNHVGSVASTGLILGAISGVVSAIGGAALALSDAEPWWSLFFFGWLLQYLGLAVFGFVCLSRRLLGAGSWLPLAAGIWLPIWALVSSIYESITGNWVDLPDIYFVILLALPALFLLLLGFRLISGGLPTGMAQTA